MIFFGWRRFGTIWKSNRGYWIATTFFHIMFIPLFPIESFIVTKNGFWNFTGVKIPLHKFSRNIAYLRGILTAGSYGVLPRLFWLFDSKENFDALPRDEYHFINIVFFISLPCLLALIATHLSPRLRNAKPDYGDSMEQFIDSLATPNPAFNPGPAATV